MSAHDNAVVPRRVAAGILLAALLATGASRSVGEDPPPPPTIAGSVKNDGSTPPVGERLVGPDLEELETVYRVLGATIEYEVPGEGNKLPKTIPSSFSGTTGESEQPKLFTITAHTKGRKTEDGEPIGDYEIYPYFHADKKLACPSPACSGPLAVQLFAKWGTISGAVLLEDDTPVESIGVFVDPSFVPQGASEIFKRREDLTDREGVFDFTSESLVPTRADNPTCFPPPPSTVSCWGVGFSADNPWGLRLLGDGGSDNRDKLYYSNKPGEFEWIVSLPGAVPPTRPMKKTLKVESSKRSVHVFRLTPKEAEDIRKQQPWIDPDGREDADDGLEGKAEKPSLEDIMCAPRPVSLLTGNVYLDQTDVSMPGLRHPTVFTRSYNSQSFVDGVLGRGWTHSFEKRIEVRSKRSLGVFIDGVPRLYTDPVGGGTFGRYGKRASSDSFITITPNGYKRSFRTGGYELYRFDGRLLQRVDRTNRATTLVYDGNVLKEVRSPEGRRLRLDYSGLLKRIVGPEGVVAEFEYERNDGVSLLTRVRYADGTGYQFTYDHRHRLLDVSDLEGVVLDRHGYEDEGNRALWSELNAGRERRSFTYEDGQTIVTDQRGLVSTFKWEQKISGKYVTEISGCGYCGPASGTRKFERDDEGRVTRYTDPDYPSGPFKTYTWVGANLTQVQDGAGRTTIYGDHDSFGRARTVSRTGFGLTRIEYAPEGPSRLTPPTGPPTEITYQNNRLTTIRSGGGLTYHFDINDLGEVQSVTDSRDEVTRYTYDGFGRPVTVERPDGQIARFAYDVAGRPSSIERPDGKRLRLAYDGSGRLASVTDPAGKATRVSYDPYDRVEAVIDPLGAVTRLAYDVMSSPISLTDALNHTTRFEYDGLGRVKSVTDALDRKEEYEYFSSGRLRLRRDRKGVETTYGYDAGGRLTSKTYSDSTPPVSIEYDDLNRRTTFSNGTDTVVVTLDAAGRLVSETSTRNGTAVSYTYNDDHQRETLSLDGEQVARYVYRRGYLDSIQFSGQELKFEYDRVGRRERLVYPNGLETRYSYVPTVGWLEKIKTLSGGTLLWEWAYGHDVVGNRTSKRSPEGLEKYTYDAGDRLTKAERSESGTGSTTWSYDLVGNRLREQGDLVSLTHTHDEANQLRATSPAGRVRVAGTTSEPATVTVQGQPARAVGGQRFEAEVPVATGDNTLVVEAKDASGNTRTSTYNVPVAAGGVTYSHDPNGNLATKTDSSGTWIYEWNAENELTRVLHNGAEVARFAYDPLGRRVEKVAGAATTRYAYDGIDILREARSDGSSPRIYSYIHGPRIDEPLARLHRSGPTEYYHADGLGSIVRVTGPEGAVVHVYVYDSWGHIESGADRAGYAFTGREWDPEAHLYYYRARYYDPKIGRFLSEDPIGFDGGINFYAYAVNNPANFVDPFGMICTYSQSTGQMTCVNDQGQTYYEDQGYSGRDQGRNNPNAQDQRDTGPIPRGRWRAEGALYDDPNMGRNVRRLVPLPGNTCAQTGRACDTFRIHGNNARNDASQGCIVLPRTRVRIPAGEIIEVRE